MPETLEVSKTSKVHPGGGNTFLKENAFSESLFFAKILNGRLLPARPVHARRVSTNPQSPIPNHISKIETPFKSVVSTSVI